MPLLSGAAKGVVGENIRTLMKEGKAQPQAIAIALHVAGKAAVKKKRAKKVSVDPENAIKSALED